MRRSRAECRAVPGPRSAASLIKFPMMLHIPGNFSVEHLEENVAATGLELSGEEVATLSG